MISGFCGSGCHHVQLHNLLLDQVKGCVLSTSVIFVLTYFLVLVLVAVFEIFFFSFSFILVIIF